MTRHDYPLSLSAALVALAALLSGPIGFGLTLLRPQPAWESPELFLASSHPLQQLPYWFGFLLIVACVMFFARAAALVFATHPTRALFALVLVGIYGAIIAINYALQAVYVPQLVRDGNAAVQYVTMVNGRAPTWILEMFGYAFLGLGTLILAPAFRSTPRGTWIRRMFVANGILSVAGAVVIAGNLAWVMTVPGLIAYFAWNGLFIAMMVLVAIEYRPLHAA
ncbi:MAG: hypothetical protein AB7T06_31165 [Kofleriaceae bacterium]